MMGQGERGRNGAIHALIVPVDAAFTRVRVGGLCVLLRAVCAAARVADRVSVLRTPSCTVSVTAEAVGEGR